MTLERAQVLVEALQRAVLEGVHEFEGEPDRIRVDLGLIPVFADERPLQGLAGLMDWRRSGQLSSLLRSGFCTGRDGERVLMPGGAGLPVDRVVLMGLGPRAEFDASAASRAARDLVAIALGLSAVQVLVALPAHAERRPAELLFAALTEAIEQVERAWEATHAAAASREVGDEPSPPAGDPGPAAGAIPADPERAISTDPPSGEASGGEDPKGEASPPASPPEAPVGEAAEGEGRPGAGEPEPPAQPEPPRTWWVVADERVVARLRRVLSGPPRATAGGLHT